MITVPAYFNDAQRRATRTAGMSWRASKVERLLNRTTAAGPGLWAAGTTEHSQFLVFDRGGTFDVSVLEC